jgi:CubicO group peptidase (beta-lactamase class C family)
MFKNKKMSHRELINWTLESQPLTADPGSRYAYSNFGYCLLGRAIEKITGQKYDEYITNALLGPSGVTDMQIAGNTLADRAVNEVKYDSQVPGQDPYDLNVARMDSHGGWIAAPIDLVRFTASIDGYRTSSLLSPEPLTIMTTPSQANPGYAKGLFVNRAGNCWHTGSLPGTATLALRTHTGFSWAAFVNTRTKFEDMLDSLDALMWHMVGSVDGWHA